MNPTAPHHQQPPVLYIAGASRSGTTLLADLLGAIPGALSVGELRHLQTYVRNDGLPRSYVDPDGARLCACGAPLSSCPFWDSVARRAGFRLADTPLRSSATAPHRRLVQALYLVGGPRAVRALAAFIQPVADELAIAGNVFQVFDAIASLTDARLIIDSDKEIYHYILLHSLFPQRMRLLVLLRDGRAVVHSEIRGTRQDRFNPRDGSPLRQATLSWKRTLELALMFSLRTRREARTTVRYEELCAAPERLLHAVVRALRLPPLPPGPFPVQRTPQHGVGGSPSRFSPGSRDIKVDETWRRALTASQLRQFRRLAGRLNRFLGYR